MSSKKNTEPSIDITEGIMPPALDHDTLKNLDKIIGYDMRVLLIQEFITYAPQQLATLQQIFNAGDTEALLHKVHQFKGECLQIGANQLGILCQNLETLAENDQLELMSATLDKLQTELARFKKMVSSFGEQL
jgi:HPt (histidine-containing phosphotransfer) domain-containing protein